MIFTEVFSMGPFLTYTCSISKYFGIAPIKHWIGSNECRENFPGLYDLENHKKVDLTCFVRV